MSPYPTRITIRLKGLAKFSAKFHMWLAGMPLRESLKFTGPDFSAASLSVRTDGKWVKVRFIEAGNPVHYWYPAADVCRVRIVA